MVFDEVHAAMSGAGGAGLRAAIEAAIGVPVVEPTQQAVAAAIGALTAVMTECTIEVERVEKTEDKQSA